MTETLGTVRYAKVKLSKDIETNKQYAVKIIREPSNRQSSTRSTKKHSFFSNSVLGNIFIKLFILIAGEDILINMEKIDK